MLMEIISKSCKGSLKEQLGKVVIKKAAVTAMVHFIALGTCARFKVQVTMPGGLAMQVRNL